MSTVTNRRYITMAETASVLRLDIPALSITDEASFSVSGPEAPVVKGNESNITEKKGVKFVIQTPCRLEGEVFNIDGSAAAKGTNITCSDLTNGQNVTTTTGEDPLVPQAPEFYNDYVCDTWSCDSYGSGG